MKYIFSLSLVLMSFTACLNKKAVNTSPVVADKNNATNFTVTGTITQKEAGKDGYMTTLEGQDGNIYIVTISIVNLQKSDGTYQDHKVGDTITVQGPGWKDEAGTMHITARQLK